MTRSPMLRALLAVALLTFTLAACGSDDDAASTPSTSTTTAASASAFPVTVEHKYGPTTIDAEPKRIVSVGLTEQDVLLDLGFTPVAVTDWFGDQPDAVWPWARAALGDAKPEVLNTSDGFQFERIAALQPDLIVGTNSGMKREDYEKLSAIAPTIAPPKGATEYFSPWDVQTQLIADSVGRHDEGAKRIADLKARFAKAAADHPEFAGKTATFSQNGFSSGELLVYPEGVNTQFLTYLGFKMNPRINDLPHKPGEQVAISQEQLPVIDADVIVFATEEPKDIANFEKVPTFTSLDAVKHHRSVFTDDTLAGAIYFMTPLSLEYVVEHLTPQLADAAAGKAPRKMR